MGWSREVLPVFQQPLCNLPVLAVAVLLDVGTLWLYDRQLRRVIPAVTGRRSMAVLVGTKQLARVQGDDGQGHVTKAMDRRSVTAGMTRRSCRSYMPCSLCLRGTTTWLPMPVTPSIPWAWRWSSRLGREDNAWFSRPLGARGWTRLMSSGRWCGIMVGSS